MNDPERELPAWEPYCSAQMTYQDNRECTEERTAMLARIAVLEGALRTIYEQGIACDYQCGWKFNGGERTWDCGCGNADLAKLVKETLTNG